MQVWRNIKSCFFFSHHLLLFFLLFACVIQSLQASEFRFVNRSSLYTSPPSIVPRSFSVVEDTTVTVQLGPFYCISGGINGCQLDGNLFDVSAIEIQGERASEWVLTENRRDTSFGGHITRLFLDITPPPNYYDRRSNRSYAGLVITGVHLIRVGYNENYQDTNTELRIPINVQSVNEIPVANEDSVTFPYDQVDFIDIDILANDIVDDGEPRIITVGTYNSYDRVNYTSYFTNSQSTDVPAAVVEINPDKTIRYTPDESFIGIDTFTYTIRDEWGPTNHTDAETVSGTITVTVERLNMPPQTTLGSTVTLDVPYDSFINDSFAPYFTDPEDDPLTFEITSQPITGRIENFDPASGSFLYRPTITTVGSDTFTVRVRDVGTNLANLPSVQVNINITSPVSLPPPPVNTAVPTSTFDIPNLPIESGSLIEPNIMLLLDDSSSMELDFMTLNGIVPTLVSYNPNHPNTDRNEMQPAINVASVLGYVDYPLTSDPHRQRRVTVDRMYYFGGFTNDPKYDPATNTIIIPPFQGHYDYHGRGSDPYFNHTTDKIGAWRFFHHSFNTLYYNPDVYYKPWLPLNDKSNRRYPQSPSPQAAPLQVRTAPHSRVPVNIYSIDLTALHSVEMHGLDAEANHVDGINPNSGIIEDEEVGVDNFKLPMYYRLTHDHGAFVQGVDIPPPELCARTHETDQGYANIWKPDDQGGGGTTDPSPHCDLIVVDNSIQTVYQGSQARLDCAEQDANPMDCSYDEEIQNFTNWFVYHRSRYKAAKAAIAEIVHSIEGVRLGFTSISDLPALEGNYKPIQAVEGNALNNLTKKGMLESIYRLDTQATVQTPIANPLNELGKYFKCQTNRYFDPLTHCPIENTDPMSQCRSNIVLLISDGNRRGNQDYGRLNVNHDGNRDTNFDGGRYADGYVDTVADVAMHLYETDLHPSIPNKVPITRRDFAFYPNQNDASFMNSTYMHQHIKTYVLSFSAGIAVTSSLFSALDISSDPSQATPWLNAGCNLDNTSAPCSATEEARVANAYDLIHTALNGRGRYLIVSDPLALNDELESLFDEFSLSTFSASNVAISSTRLRTDTKIFRASYDIRSKTGDLQAFSIDPQTGAVGTTALWSARERLGPPSITTADNRHFFTFNAPDNWDVDYYTSIYNDESYYSTGGIELIYDHLPYDIGPNSLLEYDYPEEIVDYIRGYPIDQTLSLVSYQIVDQPSYLLGEIIHSSPLFVSEPKGLGMIGPAFPSSSGKDYETFKTNNADRIDAVYVGTNAGLLHAFDADSGDEIFAYMPSVMHNDILNPDDNNYFDRVVSSEIDSLGGHILLTDGTPTVSDIFAYRNNTYDWMTLLVGGGGRGGRSYFGVNVTNPLDFQSFVSTPYPAPSITVTDLIMWEFSSVHSQHLGFATHPPITALTNVPMPSTDSGNRWMVFMGNGYNSDLGYSALMALHAEGPTQLPSGSAYRSHYWYEDKSFYVVSTGERADSAGYPNALGAPLLIDHDFNSTVDYAYAGDVQGNLYRFDLTSSDPTTWSFRKIFTAKNTSNDPQPIMSRPYAVPHPSGEGYIIIFGTGRNLTKLDAKNQDIQSVYGIWDNPEVLNHPLASESNPRQFLVSQVITNRQATNSIGDTIRTFSKNDVPYRWSTGLSATEPRVYGWYFDLDMPEADSTLTDPQFPGERAINRLVFNSDTITTSTFIPIETSADPCSRLGREYVGALLRFDPITGGDPDEQPFIDVNGDAVIDENDLFEETTLDTDGVTPITRNYTPSVLVAGGNDVDISTSLSDVAVVEDYLLINSGDSTLVYKANNETAGERSSGRLSWRELHR